VDVIYVDVIYVDVGLHFSFKNWYLHGDDWLINGHWEELISMRKELTFVEMVTW
jgi:glucan endo-1,3-alpha-glucosidase